MRWRRLIRAEDLFGVSQFKERRFETAVCLGRRFQTAAPWGNSDGVRISCRRGLAAIQRLLVITEEEALAHIIESVKPLSPRRVSLAQARDRFAAQDVLARLALPMFDNSAMDGYAVVAGSSQTGQSTTRRRGTTGGNGSQAAN